MAVFNERRYDVFALVHDIKRELLLPFKNTNVERWLLTHPEFKFPWGVETNDLKKMIG